MAKKYGTFTYLHVLDTWVIPIEYLGQPPIPWDLGGETLVGRLGSIGGPFQYEDEILLHTLWFNMVFIWFTDGMIMG